MNKTLEIVLETARAITKFNKPIFEHDIKCEKYKEAYHRRDDVMGQIVGLRTFLIHLSVSDEISETEYDDAMAEIREIWSSVLGWS